MKIKNIFFFTALIQYLLFFNSCSQSINTQHNGPVDKHNQIHVNNFKSYLNQLNRSPASPLLDVEIPEGIVSLLTEDANIGKLTIYGELRCDEENAQDIIRLRAKSIIVHGIFNCGTSTNSYDKKLIISLKKNSNDPRQDKEHRGLIVEEGGSLNLFGNKNKSKWYYLAQHATPNSQFIIVDNGETSEESTTEKSTNKKRKTPFHRNRFSISQIPWNVGDKIAIGPTGYLSSEAEHFTITAIDPYVKNKFYLDQKIQYFHWGQKQHFSTKNMGVISLEERAEVANLTRSIVIQADEEDEPIDEGNAEGSQVGGHVMVHHHDAFARISGVEFYRMGQAGILGRYPFHWHLVGDGSEQFLQDSSIHESFQRCAVIHQTSNVNLQNNVCYNFKGHGYFLEDGSEINNEIINNLAINAKAPSSSKILLRSDNTTLGINETSGRFPSVSGFWISHPSNQVTHNRVSGSIGSGFWMAFVKEFTDHHGQKTYPQTSATMSFNYNTAHSCKVGFTWDGAPTGELLNNPNNPNDRALNQEYYVPPKIPVFQKLTAFKNKLTGIYFRGHTVVFKNAVLADNGWSFWVTNNQILKDSVVIGKTANQSSSIDFNYFNDNRKDRFRKTGVVLYDGPVEVHNTNFLNFSTQKTSYSINGETLNSTVIPFTGIGGTNKFMNFTSGLFFSPEPVHRMHLQSVLEFQRDRQNLGNQAVRDLDGTLAGTNSGRVLVGTRSLGVANSSGCIEGDDSHYNFKICPASYTEGSIDFMRWGGNSSPWATPFVVRRSIDGKVQNPINEWIELFSFAIPNNAFAAINSKNHIIELGRVFKV
jgi:hypothetical protein